jgi:CPA1 family monovalent cation:H+ antiporter
MDQFLQSETLILELLLIVSIVAIIVRSLRIPYTVALVIAGLLIAFQRPAPFQITPELILTIFIPPLIFEAAVQIRFEDLRRDLINILNLAVLGIIFKTFLIGLIITFVTRMRLPIALVFGALISTTDPVAVVALIKSLGAPRRLGILIEAESLFNDGPAIVLFNLILAIAITGQLNWAEGILDFFRVSIGGMLVGLILGWLIFQVISRVNDYLIDITLTTILAFGSYLIAEHFQFSGVLAVAAAGLVNGNIGPRGMSPTTRIVIDNYWEYVAFFANSLIFLLIGLQVNIPRMLANWQPILWGVIAVLLARGIVVYGLGWVVNRWGEPIPWRWRHVLLWGGMRGAICLALALSLPQTLGADRDLITTMTFGVVLFTLLVQGLTIRPFVNWLKIVPTKDPKLDYAIRRTRLISLRVGLKRIEKLAQQGLLSSQALKLIRPSLEQRISTELDQIHEMQHAEPDLLAYEYRRIQQEFLQSQKSAAMDLRREGIVSGDAIESVIAEIDQQLISFDETGQGQRVLEGTD